MAAVSAFEGIRYNPDHVRLGGVLAPPYDVISDAARDALYGRDLRNIVRVDFGIEYADDVAGVNDRYVRAAGFLESWQQLGVLVQDPAPRLYVHDHEFTVPGGGQAHRRGLLATVAAAPWDRAVLLPHERTMLGPKQDRLALLRATRMQTSPVFAVWTGGEAAEGALERAMSAPPDLGGRTDGELGSEKHLLWSVGDPQLVAALQGALGGAGLYVADGHHRYETAFAYAAERRAAEPAAPADAPFERCLVYLAAAADPALTILATHRLVRHRPGLAFSLDDLWARLDDAWEAEPQADVDAALETAAAMRETHHAFAVIAHDGTALLQRARRGSPRSPRAGLDASVLEDEVLAPAGIDSNAIAAGALQYTRDAAELTRQVAAGTAVLGFGLQPVTADDVVRVADAGETMPQKSTYFYPKVPTGLVLYPV